MVFDPSRLASLSDADRAKLQDELGKEAWSDLEAHIADLGARAKAGDDVALQRLTRSASASLAVALLQWLVRFDTDAPEGEIHRTAMAQLPGLGGVVVLGALQTALLVFGDMGPERIGTSQYARQLVMAQAISLDVWKEVSAFLLSGGEHVVGTRRSAGGSDIFVAPVRK